MKVPKNHKTYAVLMSVQILLILVVVIGGFVITNAVLSFIPAIVGVVIGVILAVVLSKYYYAGASFKCSECNEIFKPSEKDFMKSLHVKKGREFTCPKCNKKVVCKEGFIYSDKYR